MKRIKYLDLAKFTAMFLVCSYHYALSLSLSTYASVSSLALVVHKIYNLLALTAVPIFFMANGAILLNRNLNIKKHYLLIFKTVSFFYIYWIISVILMSQINNVNLFDHSKTEILNYLLTTNPPGVSLQHIWFIRRLISLYLIFPLIHTVYQKTCEDSTYERYTFNLIVGSLLVLNSQQIVQKLAYLSPFFANISFAELQSFIPVNNLFLVMTFYFVIGGVFHKKYYIEEQPINLITELVKFLVSSIVLFSIWMFMAKSGSPFDIVFDNYTTITGFYLSITSFKILIKLGTTINFPSKIMEILKLVSANTIHIYFWHWILATYLITFFNHIFPSQGNALWLFIANAMKSLILIAGISYVSELLRKLSVAIRMPQKVNWFILTSKKEN